MRILLIEDNEGDARLISEAARDTGVDVEIVRVTRVSEALSQLDAQTFDVALTDLGLPDSTGLDTVTRLRAATQSLPLVVLTGVSVADDGIELLRAGADDYLVKGHVDADALSRSLRHAVERKRFALGAAEAAREQARMAETIHRIGSLVISELDLNALVQTVTDEATALTGAAFGAFFYNVLDERGESYTLYTISGVPRDMFAHFPMPRNTQVFDPTFRGDGVVRSDDITKDPRYGKNAPYFGMPAGHLPVCSYLGVPVISRAGEVIGGLFFGHPEPGVFTATHEQMVIGIAGSAALAMDNARLYEMEHRAREEAENANRAKADFLATMSHELRTPLNAMIGYTDLWLMGLPERLPTSLVGQVERVRLSATHLLQLIEEILSFSRLEAAQETVEADETSLGDIVQAAASVVEALAVKKGLKFNIEAPAATVRMFTDARKCKQILINLLSNAVKFTANGSVSLAVSIIDTTMLAVVADTGEGIAEENLERIFEPFFQAPHSNIDRPGGTGLGLSVSRKLAGLLGGTLEVESTPGAGSRFILRLPLEAPPVTEEPQNAA
jgi:signal transduction histidine kinase/DNA-binding response OmpR family regulator